MCCGCYYFFVLTFSYKTPFDTKTTKKIKMATCGELLGTLIQQNNALVASASWNFGFQILSCGFSAALAPHKAPLLGFRFVFPSSKRPALLKQLSL